MKKHVLVLIAVFFTGILFAQSAKKLYKQGKKEAGARKYDAAIILYSRAIDLKPGNYDYLMSRAQAYEKVKRPAEAVKDYTEALNIRFKSEELHLKVIDLNLKLERYGDALAVSERLLTLDRWHIEGLGRKAISLIMLKRFAEAQVTCDLAMEKSIYNHALHYYKGLAQDSLKNYTGAVDSYQKAIKLMRVLDENSKQPKPRYKPYYYNLAVAQDRLKQYDESLKNFDQALSMDAADTIAPKNYQVLFQRSFPNFNKSEYNIAVNDLNKAIVINPQEKKLFYRRAFIHRTTSQTQSAINDYTKCILLDDKDAEAYFGRGDCYLELTDYKNAITDLAKSLELRPGVVETKEALDLARKKYYEANREADPPTIKLEYPQVDNGGFTNVLMNQQDMLIEGEVRDRSAMEYIRINGINAEIKTEDKISVYSCKVPLRPETRRIDIVARDIYNNQTEKTIKIGRVIDESRSKVLFAGKLLADDDLKTPYSNRLVYLTNEKGEILYSARTDITGAFVFRELPYDRTYLVKLDASDLGSVQANTKRFILANDKGVTVAYADGDGKGKFTYRLLPFEPTVMQELMMIDDIPLRVDIGGRLLSGSDNATPIGEVNIQLVNDKMEAVAVQKTDASGTFRFTNLAPGDNYTIRIAEADAQKVSFNKIVVTDERGRVVKEIMRDGKGEFTYRLLSSERTMLSAISMTDPWLRAGLMAKEKKEMMIIENIYYESGAWAILPEAEKILQKAIDAMKANLNIVIEVQSHTDAVAGDDFNMELSQKRAKAVVDYLVLKGIDKKRLTAKGFGESQLVNYCTNGVDCSDAEHRQNRRTIFKIDYAGK